jgi:hypothetical protein
MCKKYYTYTVKVYNEYCQPVDWVSCLFDNPDDGVKWSKHMERVLSKHYNDESLKIFYIVNFSNDRWMKGKQWEYGVVTYCCEYWGNKYKFPHLFNSQTIFRGSFRGA